MDPGTREWELLHHEAALISNLTSPGARSTAGISSSVTAGASILLPSRLSPPRSRDSIAAGGWTAMAEESSETPQRWTAKRRAAPVLSIVKGETCPSRCSETWTDGRGDRRVAGLVPPRGRERAGRAAEDSVHFLASSQSFLSHE